MNDYIDLFDETTIHESELPNVVSRQFDNIAALEKQVTDSVNLAAKARQKAEKAQVSAGLFKKKEAIQLLQSAAEEQSNALISLADAQKLSFDYQNKLTEITQYLFGLGVSNLAMNRSVIRELELRLQGASEEDISNLAKQELRNVINQLKQQRDMLDQQEKLTGKVKEHSGQLKNINERLSVFADSDNEQDLNIAANAKKIEQHTEALLLHQMKDEEMARVLAEKDKIHDKELSKHAMVLSSQQKKDLEHDDRIKKIRNRLKSL